VQGQAKVAKKISILRYAPVVFFHPPLAHTVYAQHPCAPAHSAITMDIYIKYTLTKYQVIKNENPIQTASFGARCERLYLFS
jgi:hypothetical protein